MTCELCESTPFERLTQAVDTNNVSELESLLEQGVIRNLSSDELSRLISGALGSAFPYGFDRFLDEGVLEEMAEERRVSVLHYAVLLDDISATGKLIDRGVDPGAFYRGMDALQEALCTGKKRVARYLLDRGAPVQPTGAGSDIITVALQTIPPEDPLIEQLKVAQSEAALINQSPRAQARPSNAPGAFL